MQRPAQLVPGQRFQRDFGSDGSKFERFLVLPDGRVEMYEGSPGVGAVGAVYAAMVIPWDQTHELPAVPSVPAAVPAAPRRAPAARVSWGAFWCSGCRRDHAGECG
jgi:hypothetical protein